MDLYYITCGISMAYRTHKYHIDGTKEELKSKIEKADKMMSESYVFCKRISESTYDKVNKMLNWLQKLLTDGEY